MSSDLKNWADWLVSCAGGGIPDEARAAYGALDRIEQLERDIDLLKSVVIKQQDSRDELKRELAAEKALADALHFALTNSEHADINAVFAAYRKARGL